MTTYSWSIVRMDVMASVDGKTDMVVTVAWECTGQQNIDGFFYSGTVTGESPIPYIPEDPWVDYANLTQSEVLVWVWEHAVNQQLVEAQAQGIIDSTPKPPVITKPLPW